VYEYEISVQHFLWKYVGLPNTIQHFRARRLLWALDIVAARAYRVSVPKNAKPTLRKKGGIDLRELKPEDFQPVSRETLGKGLARLAKQPKKKAKE